MAVEPRGNIQLALLLREYMLLLDFNCLIWRLPQREYSREGDTVGANAYLVPVMDHDHCSQIEHDQLSLNEAAFSIDSVFIANPCFSSVFLSWISM